MADKIRQARTLFDQQREDYLSRRTRNYVKSWEIPNFGIPSGWKRDLQAEGFILNGRPDYDLPASFMEELYGTDLNPNALPVENLSGKPAYSLKVPGFIRRNWKIGAAGAGLLGLYAIQPLSWFSGRDDSYNTIEGLKHGGFAEKKRKVLTNFGSGFIGFKGKEVTDFIRNMIGTATNLSDMTAVTLPVSPKAFAAHMTRSMGMLKQVIRPEEWKGLSTTERKGFKDFFRSMRRAARTKAADKPGLVLIDMNESNTHVLKGLVAHEQVHLDRTQAWLLAPLRVGNFTRATSQYKGFKDYLIKANYNAGNKATYDEEFIAYLRQYLVAPKSVPLEIRSHLESYTKAVEIINKFPVKIPGADDAYNLIEGLRHGGVAEKIRKGMTEFGSGWRGMFSGIAKDFNEIAKIIGHTPTTSFQAGLKTPKKNILEAIDETIKQKKIKMITSQEEALKFGLTTKDWEGHALSGALKPEFTGTGYKDYILLNKEGLIDHLSKHRGLTTKEAESILPVVKAHELSEVHHFQTTMSHDINLAITHDIRKKMNLFGSHRSGAVIADELLTAASLGSETYQAMRKFRLSELSGIEESLGLFSKKQQKEYIKRTRKIVSSFEQKQLHKFIGADEANRIKLRTSEMSKIQRQGVMQLFKNAISGGKRSKMIYGASKR